MNWALLSTKITPFKVLPNSVSHNVAPCNDSQIGLLFFGNSSVVVTMLLFSEQRLI